ncbi:MAG: hypothetical protein A2255_10785 [Candidatus Melainabacteria bacterium RIFOXYA2_FULL_32_9]|nr:MAG: hypothetical protein A2255_10785 [Candidatus Melainabacteria bacterium RIFOXYA2_FULL_32_9]
MLLNIEKALKNLLGNDSRPIVIYSAIWPFARIVKLPEKELCKAILDILVNVTGPDRTLFMPTFTNGFKDGICDLDKELSLTGTLSEEFRKLKHVRRTICPFFSFAALGPDTSKVVNLRPIDAWGEDSLYEWLHNNDAHIVTLGLHPTHCSFTHRAEWLTKDKITYRYIKEFDGNIIHEGQKIPVKERLFVRQLNPSPINDFTWLLDKYKQSGMQQIIIEGISISEMSAKAKINTILEVLEIDSLALIKNRNEFEKD